MNAAVIQLLVLAGVAIFLILRLRSVLGTREGFEKPRVQPPAQTETSRNVQRDFEVIDGGADDRDITDYVEEGSTAALALASMKSVEPSFSVSEFLGGARGAYEMILMAFENGDLSEIEPFLASDVYESFAEVIAMREEQGLSVDASFVGIRELTLQDAEFDLATNTAELSVRFVGELTSVVRNGDGEIVEGNPNEIKRQRDTWTFGRVMGADDPNWQLVATGE